MNRGLFMECPLGRCLAASDAVDGCGNCRLQKRQFPEIEVFETASRGHGLRLKQSVPEGTMVAEYLGEVITPEECLNRMQQMDATDDFYFASLGGGLVLDALNMGSEARFANHSCEPNAELQKWSVLGEWHIALVTTRDVEEGEEVTYNYNYHMDGLADQLKRQPCLCGSKHCSGTIGGRVSASAADQWRDRAQSLLSRCVRIDALEQHVDNAETCDVSETEPMFQQLQTIISALHAWQLVVNQRLQSNVSML